MAKTTRNTLTQQVQTQLIAYLQSGRPLDTDSIAAALDTTEREIEDLERLLRIRFVLSDPVQTYLDELHENLRRVRTETRVERTESRGEIRGSIDWGQTIRTRYSENPEDESRFILRTSETEYQLPENVLLKKLLSTIATVTREDIREIDQLWRRSVWSDGEISEFLRLIDQNVHLDRINADADSSLSTRALDRSRQSRQELYYAAYDLYRLDEQLQNLEFTDGDSTAARILLETLQIPDTATLFELAVIFRLLDSLQSQLAVTIRRITGGGTPVAVMEDKTWTYRVYHDTAGELRFDEPMPEKTPTEYLSRTRDAAVSHRDAMGNDGLRSLFSGRPDLIIDVRPRDSPSQQPVHVVLGEFKHTTSESTLSDGVYELAKYLEFARPGGSSSTNWEIPPDSYLLDSSDVSMTGVVVSDDADVELNTCSLPIRHLQYQTLSESDLASVVRPDTSINAWS